MRSSNICRRMAIQPIDAILGVPATFHWLGVPVSARVDGGVLALSAGPRTDWFVDPASGDVTLNAPALLGSLPGDFLLAARLKVSFASTFDAGALVLWQDERTFAKLAFEFSPQRQPLVVSVVTRGESDDCNSVAIDDGGRLVASGAVGPRVRVPRIARRPHLAIRTPFPACSDRGA